MKNKARKSLLSRREMVRAALRAGVMGVAMLMLSASGAEEKAGTQPVISTQTDGHVTISAGDLTVTFADNSAFGEHHRAGYNGIADLRHKEQPENVFVPLYAGFNLEHIFGGDRLEQLFEPRSHPMTLKQVSDRSVVLYQSPTPLSSVETTITFTVTPPHYIDIRAEHIAHKKDFFKHGYLGTFWASYINAPEDKRIYFLGTEPGNEKPHWISAFSEKHMPPSRGSGGLLAPASPPRRQLCEALSRQCASRPRGLRGPPEPGAGCSSAAPLKVSRGIVSPGPYAWPKSECHRTVPFPNESRAQDHGLR